MNPLETGRHLLLCGPEFHAQLVQSSGSLWQCSWLAARASICSSLLTNNDEALASRSAPDVNKAICNGGCVAWQGSTGEAAMTSRCLCPQCQPSSTRKPESQPVAGSRCLLLALASPAAFTAPLSSHHPMGSYPINQPYRFLPCHRHMLQHSPPVVQRTHHLQRSSRSPDAPEVSMPADTPSEAAMTSTISQRMARRACSTLRQPAGRRHRHSYTHASSCP